MGAGGEDACSEDRITTGGDKGLERRRSVQESYRAGWHAGGCASGVSGQSEWIARRDGCCG